MKSKLVLALMIFVGLSMTLHATEDPKFEISFVQNGQTIKPVHGVIKLKKQPFAVQVDMTKKMHLMVAASQKSKVYKTAMKNEHIHEMSIFAEKGMVEGKFNPEKNILLSDKQPNYWYFSTEKSNRFDKTVVDEYSTKVTCTRTVTHFTVYDSKEEIDVSEIVREVYLVFITTKVGNNSLDKIEVQRLPVKIEWEEGSSILEERDGEEDQVE